ncbi:hypothetical protein MMC28_002259 [Mycoblastus sanguinarius]|nr:hypothetical protein [Mycoblastus sanguinarius]
MHISYQALVLAALSLECAFAQPAHRHQHKHKRDLLDEFEKRVDYNDPSLYEDVNWASVFSSAPGPTSTPSSSSGTVATNEDVVVPAGGSKSASSSPSAPVASSTPTSQSSSSSSSSNTGSCNDLSSVWTTGDSTRNNAAYGGDGSDCPGGCTSTHLGKFTSFGTETAQANVGQTDGYIGNIGSPYGHNMLPLPDCNIGSNQYSITFTNNETSPIQVVMWNKIGDDSGWTQTAPQPRVQTGMGRNAFFQFSLAPQQSAVFAIQANSQIAFSQACGRSSSTGQFDCTWGEADFADEQNGGASGYDRSSIPNSAGNTGNLAVCADGYDCSTATSESFTNVAQLSTGGKTNIPAGQSFHAKVYM